VSEVLDATIISSNAPPIGGSLGASFLPGRGVSARVWAPLFEELNLVIDGIEMPMTATGGGYFETWACSARVGSRYGFRPPGNKTILPDPASRYQPEGPFALSAIVDPSSYDWAGHNWSGPDSGPQLIYELNVGTFTREGTWAAAAGRLQHLAELGVTIIEIMPIAEFPGRFGWSYDGVFPFAPSHLYGTPDDLRRFVDAAHRYALAVILDVNYNHYGPNGNILPAFSEDYVTHRYKNEWGDAVNFDGPSSENVRAFILANAAYWIREFHFDGLRLDATQQIFDQSPTNIIAEIAETVRSAAGSRRTYIVAENESQDVTLVRSTADGGYGLNAIWNEDFHHSARIALTGRLEAYYSDYTGQVRELLSCTRHGFLYQGQRSRWQSKPRGFWARGLPLSRTIAFLENHDQIANTRGGARLAATTDRGLWRALMLFQGQEFASSRPFTYFADHHAPLSDAVARGRDEFLRQFPSLSAGTLPRPDDIAAFENCKLDWTECDRNTWSLRLYKDLGELRRCDGVLGMDGEIDGAMLSEQAFLVRFFGGVRGDRLLIVNLGSDVRLGACPEPLTAPSLRSRWQLLWSSEDPCYGGEGTPDIDPNGTWYLPGRAAVVLTSRPA